MSAMLPAQTLAIEELPFDSRTSHVTRIVKGHDSGTTGFSAFSANAPKTYEITRLTHSTEKVGVEKILSKLFTMTKLASTEANRTDFVNSKRWKLE